MFIVTASRALELELDERCVQGPEAAARPAACSRALAPRGAARGERGGAGRAGGSSWKMELAALGGFAGTEVREVGVRGDVK